MKETLNSREQIRTFISRWQNRGYEKGESQPFWLDFLHDVLNIQHPSDMITFESQVHLANTSFIDAYIPSSRVLIEQKSIDRDLRRPVPQSDGSLLTPFQQAKRYASELPLSRHPRWVITSNFRSFLIYDMEQPQGEPFEVLLQNLERDAHLFSFIISPQNDQLRHEMEVSIEAGSIVGRLYDALLLQYGENPTPQDLHALNVLCVRLVFCLYAEDAGIFSKCQFANYLLDFSPTQIRTALRDLFSVLDTPIPERDRFLEPKLKAFPYVNGSLFRSQPGETIPPFSPENTNLLIQDASLGFDWSQISPTIFGAVFESTLNPDTRRSGGMHYTSIENIHKVIDPLFMNNLLDEFNEISQRPEGKPKHDRLESFQLKLASLHFLDPACGSGNFLTETYVSLRRLENRVIQQLTHDQMLLAIDEANPIKVSIHQFFGIEINDFAVTVAKTALWIAEAQMMNETERIIRFTDDYLPLKTYNNIIHANALRTDWNSLVPASSLNYIIGNPPFIGARLKTPSQADDLIEIFGKQWKNLGNIDYVAGWYLKAAQLTQLNPDIRAALVSTNSITQGEQVSILWKPLFEQYGIHINFAYRTFRWDSESTLKAHVHCVIVGFSQSNNTPKKLYESGNHFNECQNINAYLIDAPDVFIDSRTKSICNVPKMGIGNKPIDGGFYLFSQEQKDNFVKSEPKSEQYFRRWYGAEEFINNKVRYCLWLGDCTPSDLRSMPHCYDRVASVRDFRLASSSEGTRKIAEKPTRFHVENMPSSDYIIVPRHSSEKRLYVPIGYVPKEIICGDANMMIPDATIYHFGILTSSTHMSWMRAVCGRLEMRYRYSKDIVYNNFPWPSPSDSQKQKIEQTAHAILLARSLYPDSSLADLYDDLTMPPELRRAHLANDLAVLDAYSLPHSSSEPDIVAHLLLLYQSLTKL